MDSAATGANVVPDTRYGLDWHICASTWHIRAILLLAERSYAVPERHFWGRSCSFFCPATPTGLWGVFLIAVSTHPDLDPELEEINVI
jgi:hypothetical protein